MALTDSHPNRSRQLAKRLRAETKEEHMSIIHHADYLELSLPVSKALMAFAGTDKARPHLGIGFEDGMLCATDGHVLIHFDAACRSYAPETQPSPATLTQFVNRKYWARAHVEQAVKLARLNKATSVQLSYADMSTGFPPCAHIIPTYGLELSGPVKFDPQFMAAMVLACKACGDDGVTLTRAKGECDPMAFRIGTDRGEVNLTAGVVLMPLRQEGSLKKAFQKRTRRAS